MEILMKHVFLRALVPVTVLAFLMAWPGGTRTVSAAPFAMFDLNTFDCFSGPQYPKNPPPGYVCSTTLAGSQLTGLETKFTPIKAGIVNAALKIYSPKGEILYKAELICANCKKGTVPENYELRLGTKDQKDAEKFLVKGNRLEVVVKTGARVTNAKMEFDRGSPEKR
jgi:hypothetical protein